MTVICDWLDVTYAPDNTPERAVLDVLQLAGAECIVTSEKGSSWRVGDGVFKLEYARTHHRYSASGAVLEKLREAGVYMDYLSALSEAPVTVTRLDAAHDVLSDAPPILAKLRKRFPRECSLSRKAVRTKFILEVREDGKETGTWYVGHRSKARVTARVYDKQNQMLERHGVLLPPMTRYELTFKKDIGATLRDAAEPESLFWHYASPVLLKRPENVPEWSSGWAVGWHYERPEIALGELLKSRIGASGELQAILALADRADCMEWCGQLILRMIADYDRQHAPESTPEWQPTPAMVEYAKKLKKRA